MNQGERRRFLIDRLVGENSSYCQITVPPDSESQKQLLRGLMNIREPHDIDEEFLSVQDKYLTSVAIKKGIVSLDRLATVKDGIYLWQGDITTLQCDAVVNAANSGMTGCYVPNHRCIDNCIHSYAGIQLRLECSEMMKRQGYEEATGAAKITNAYNLPCRYIIHTVGPIINGVLTKKDCELLKKCYQSCLHLAAEHNLESLAFCCISTGEYHFPNDKAAEIAVNAVTEFMKLETSVKKVIFNVFKDVDKEIYGRLLQ